MPGTGNSHPQSQSLVYVHHSLQPADVYLIDEPSAYLDSEQRLVAAKVIKRSVVAVVDGP